MREAGPGAKLLSKKPLAAVTLSLSQEEKPPDPAESERERESKAARLLEVPFFPLSLSCWHVGGQLIALTLQRLSGAVF